MTKNRLEILDGGLVGLPAAISAARPGDGLMKKELPS